MAEATIPRGYSYRRIAIIGGLGSWSDAMDEMVVAITMPLIMAWWKISMAEIAFLLSLLYIGFLISSLVGGPIVDYIGRKKGFVIGNLLAGASYIIYLVAPSFHWWYAARVLSGFFACLSTVSFYTWIAEETPPEKRQTIIGRATAMAVVGTLNISLMLILAGIYGWTWHVFFAYVAAFDIMVAILGALLLKESSMWLRRLELMKEGKLPKETRVPLSKLISKEYRARFFLTLLLSIAGWFGLLFTVLPFFATYMKVALGFGLALIGVVEMVSTINGTVSRPVIGWLSDRIGRLNTFLLCGVLGILGTQLALRTPFLVGVGEYMPVVLFFVITWVIFIWGLNGLCDTSRTWYAELVPTGVRASMESFAHVLASVIAFFATVIVGVLAGWLGLATALTIPPLIGGIIVIVVALLGKKLGLETKGRPLEL